MNPLTITPLDRKVLAWVILLLGALLTGGGLTGVWLQGLFYEKGFPTAATVGEVRNAFTWPTLFTTLGALTVGGILFGSPITLGWSSRRRWLVYVGFVVLVLGAAALCGHVAANRVAKILN